MKKRKEIVTQTKKHKFSKNLLIIESPNKIETINKFLKEKDFTILATIGHIRDLSSRGMGFDEKTLEPNWIVSNRKNPAIKDAKTKHEIINEIKLAANNAENIYLATDPDREGEAISWHVYELLDDKDKYKVHRITFNEITKTAIEEALSKPRQIDINWVQSQFARRILDRLVGYKLSKLVRRKLSGSSAGRVQTVALKFIYDREQEIKKFKEKKWWTVNVILENDIKLILREIDSKIKSVNVVHIDEQQGAGIDFKDEISAKNFVDQLEKKYKIYSIDEPKMFSSNPREPYKTSTLQQDAINKLSWTVDRVTSIAQKLYEGIKLDGEHTALISYPRTDSTRISDVFSNQLKKYIIKTYGEQYYQFRVFGSKKNDTNIQNAHEGIRVIDVNITPTSIKKHISKDEYSLYKLIWMRTVASFMSPAKYENIIVRFENGKSKFYSYNRKIVFDGYRKVYDHYEDNQVLYDIKLSNLKKGLTLESKNVEIKEHVSAPPPRFNQASLIKILDEVGVGRPSTYKSMANMALQRGYAQLISRAYHINDNGVNVIEGLDKYFPYITNPEFTKNMEDHLDEIANKDEKWKEWILEFAPKLDKDLKKAYEKMPDPKPEEVGRRCPKCKSKLIYRHGKKTGLKFIGCSSFPKCKYVEFPGNEQKVLDEICPLCGKHLIERKNKRGQPFIGCSGYPACHYIKKVPKVENNDNIKTENNNQELPELKEFK